MRKRKLTKKGLHPNTILWRLWKLTKFVSIFFPLQLTYTWHKHLHRLSIFFIRYHRIFCVCRVESLPFTTSSQLCNAPMSEWSRSVATLCVLCFPVPMLHHQHTQRFSCSLHQNILEADEHWTQSFKSDFWESGQKNV